MSVLLSALISGFYCALMILLFLHGVSSGVLHFSSLFSIPFLPLGHLSCLEIILSRVFGLLVFICAYSFLPFPLTPFLKFLLQVFQVRFDSNTHSSPSLSNTIVR